MHERLLYEQRVVIEDTENGREIEKINQPKTKYTHFVYQKQRERERELFISISFRNAPRDGVRTTFYYI